MTTLTIQITDDSFSKLKEEAQSLGLTPEELARIAIEQAATPPDQTFKGLLSRDLEENAELYRRLA